MLSVQRQVELRDPVLLCAFTGWSDAASAASGALTYLLMKWPGQELASYDPESIYNYTITRPVIRRRRSGRRSIQWPALTFTALPLPHAERDLLLLVGPEPDLRWQACTRAAVELAAQLGVTQLLGLGCFYAPVAHSAAVPLVATATDQTQRAALVDLGLSETGYEGPTGFLTAILDRARQSGIPGAGIWAAAPNYLPGMPNPNVSNALLVAAEKLLHLRLGREELEVNARDLDERIEAALRQRPDLREMVDKLRAGESAAESEQPQSTDPPAELPSAEAVLDDLEQYLKSLQKPDEEHQSN